jgi:uncharacterized delta-60 repeat protein
VTFGVGGEKSIDLSSGGWYDLFSYEGRLAFDSSRVYVDSMVRSNLRTTTIDISAFDLTDGTASSTFNGGSPVEITRTFGITMSRFFKPLSDGKLLVVYQSGSQSDYSGVGVARLNSDGTFDSTWGGDGNIDFGAVQSYLPVPRTAAVAADGSVFVAGCGDPYGCKINPWATAPYTFVSAKILPDGTGLDASFAGGAIDDQWGETAGRSMDSMVALDDGSIVMASVVATAGVTQTFDVVKYNAAGQRDATFGSGGKVSLTLSTSGGDSVANRIVVDANGRFVVAGHVDDGGTVKAVVARLLADGTVDNTFGTNGVVKTVFTGASADAVDLQLLGTDKIFVGVALDRGSGNYDQAGMMLLQ